MSKKVLSVAVATTGLKEDDLPIALAVYTPYEKSLSEVFTFRHDKPSHPVALVIHKFTQEDCAKSSLLEQSLVLHDLFQGAEVYAYNAFFTVAKLNYALYFNVESVPTLYPFPAVWRCTMNMAQAHFAHERESGIEAGALNATPKFYEVLKRLEIDDKGLYQDDAKEALMQRAILNYEIVKRIEARRQEFLASLIL